MIRYVKNEEHYNLLLEQIANVRHTLWIGTADLKDLYVKKGDKAVPFLALLDEKVRKGVAVRLLHAKEPGENFCRDFDGDGVELYNEEAAKWFGLAAEKVDKKATNHKTC